MRKTLFVLLLLLGCTSDEPSHPISHPTLARRAYFASYDGQHKQPSWVYERLTATTLQGDVERDGFSFVEDPNLPKSLRSSNADYKGSSFDRGHLCPAGNAHGSSEAMAETFYLSNISPQVPSLNRGLWRKLETHVRRLTEKYPVLHVYTGPLYLSYKDKDGKRYVKYQVIGDNEVAVPTHYFKAIFTQGHISMKFIEGYIVPNQTIEADQTFDKFKASVEKIERSAGLVFSSR